MFDIVMTWLLLMSSILIGIVSNPVHSVLFLVLTFFVASVSLLSMGLEFLSLLFLVIYMGAIAVLFLFVVMMLDFKDKELDDPLTGSLGLLVSLVFVPSLAYSFQHISTSSIISIPNLVINPVSSIESMGQLLYTEVYLFYLVAGFVLLVSLMGAIILAVPRPFNMITLKEDLSHQLARDASDAVFTVKKYV